MSKIGVGVGEEFPADEPTRPQPDEQSEEGARCCGEDWHRQREMRREAWRRFRHQMHAEWRARRRAFRDEFNRQDGVEILGPETLRGRHLAHLVLGGLAVIGLAALLNHHRRY
ncbi:MAG TPA: hypothetical protein VMU01_05115 [Rhizomicrobium sp.]|nr:hypothetical protein [Rhizomicrobium sp.]